MVGKEEQEEERERSRSKGGPEGREGGTGRREGEEQE